VVDTNKSSIYVACGKGVLKITEVQMEGKKRMPVSEFLKGHQIKAGDRFSPPPASSPLKGDGGGVGRC